jgi:hypothetical protein
MGGIKFQDVNIPRVENGQSYAKNVREGFNPRDNVAIESWPKFSTSRYLI